MVQGEINRRNRHKKRAFIIRIRLVSNLVLLLSEVQQRSNINCLKFHSRSVT
jgi:hypothetical protein